MVKYICDRCERELEEGKFIRVDVLWPGTYHHEDDAYELCNICTSELNDWMKAGAQQAAAV